MPLDKETASERQKRQRACDFCRRRKTKCNGFNMPNRVCSLCISNRTRCTYTESAQKEAPPEAYVRALEDRVRRMDVVLKRLCPGNDYSHALDDHSEAARHGLPKPALPHEQLFPPSASHPILVTAHDHIDAESSDDEVADSPETSLYEHNDHVAPRFFGKSSTTGIVRQAVETKSALAGETHIRAPQQLEDWHMSSWERKGLWHRYQPRTYKFPEPDLLRTLVDAYFVEINILWPLLHRPVFEKLLADGLHLADDEFAVVVLLVCANGSRFIDDQRVLSDGYLRLSAGWKYFNQVQIGQNALLKPPSLFHLQMRCLAVVFLQGSSAPQKSWVIIGVGIRLAQDVGAHRRKVYGSKPSILREQWKRAFWCLVLHDRRLSSIMGRACAIQDEDFDLDMPIDCDDEYWEPSIIGKAFEQPKYRPSHISFFIWDLKLQHIVAFALRTIYSINRSKVALGFVGMEWKQKTVAQLDAALDQWVQSIPEHLRWDAERVDETFFHQSAILRCSYYAAQIMIYQAFIAYPTKSPLRRPALEICSIAARECSLVLAVHQRRRKTPLPLQLASAITSALVLLVRIWGGNCSSADENLSNVMECVHTCMEVLKGLESHWSIAGRLRDELHEILDVDELLTSGSTPSSERRQDGSIGPSAACSLTDIAPSMWTSGADTILREQLQLYNRRSAADPPSTQAHIPSVPSSTNLYDPSGTSTAWASQPGSRSEDALWQESCPEDADAPSTTTGEVAGWLTLPFSWQTNKWDSWIASMSAAE